MYGMEVSARHAMFATRYCELVRAGVIDQSRLDQVPGGSSVTANPVKNGPRFFVGSSIDMVRYAFLGTEAVLLVNAIGLAVVLIAGRRCSVT
jgi:hypothetical protein